MIELTSKQFRSLSGNQLISLLNLTQHKYSAVWVDDVRVWVWHRQKVVYVSPTIAPDKRRLCGKESDRVNNFVQAPVEITQAYLEGVGYNVDVRASGFTVTRGGKVIEHVDDGKNVHQRYALRAMAVNRRLAWEKVRQDYGKK